MFKYSYIIKFSLVLADLDLLMFSWLVYLYIGFLNPPTECINPWYLFKPCYQNIMYNSLVFENKHFSFFHWYFGAVNLIIFGLMFKVMWLSQNYTNPEVFD